MEWNEYQAEGFCHWDNNINVAYRNTISNSANGVNMKDWKLISPYFYFLIGATTLVLLLDMGTITFYACNRISWLSWITKVPWPTIFDFVLLFGPPLWLGLKCSICLQRNVFLYGMSFTLVLGIISNVFVLLEWYILMGCSPDIYTYAGFKFVNISSWLVLPIGALLGGVAALIGYKWSKATLDEKNKQGKKRYW